VTHDAEGDAVLVQRLARAKDPGAFDTLYRRHTPALYATAVRIAGNSDWAADLVHDTWLRAVESLVRFSNRSSFRTWLTGILINCHRERSRERRRAPAQSELAAEDSFEIASVPPLDAARIDPIDLEAAVAALPPGFREVFVLHDIEGFTHDEIAELLGLVAGTSKSQLSRARQRIRQLLERGVPRTLS
jgi:RNA polymerase sigma-70 factor (ECF subfamily)